MRIAILGTRGIPARYGGFETCVEEISVRLAAKGHEVTVYCVGNGSGKKVEEYKGVRLIHVGRDESKPLAYVRKTFVSCVLALFSDAEVLHFFGSSREPLTLLGRLFGKAVVLTVDGLEWNRSSYSTLARMVMRSYAELAMVFPDVTVADSKSTQAWYSDRTGVIPEYIPYGTDIMSDVDTSVLDKYNLRKGEYVLFVGRLVREKGAHTLVEAFKKVKTDLRLVIVGDDPGSGEYLAQVKQQADERTVFLGAVYGEDFAHLRNGALVYVHPSLLDGTSISLLGAMGAGKCILSSDLQENFDVAADSAMYFKMDDSNDLACRLQRLLDSPHAMKDLGDKARDRAGRLHTWDVIADRYERVYDRALGKTKRLA